MTNSNNYNNELILINQRKIIEWLTLIIIIIYWFLINWGDIIIWKTIIIIK
jgi:hypothetical protein